MGRLITSPYNFAPLSEKVYCPSHWGEPSHDMPFSDGVSGSLALKIIAKTPMYIRGSHSKPEGEDRAGKQRIEEAMRNGQGSEEFNAWLDFCRDDSTGIYAIPGATLKGVIRNLIKIISAGSIGETDVREARSRALPSDHRKVSPKPIDVAERLFGFVDESRANIALRGRVWFTSQKLISDDLEPFDLETPVLLGSPKLEFFPAYLNQGKRDEDGKLLPGVEYCTWNSKAIRIRGWKRYLVAEDNDPDDGRKIRHLHNAHSMRAATRFRALPAGCEFSGTMKFHNLRPAELGALVWALEWGGQREYRHSIGMGKSMGMGSALIQIDRSASKLGSVGENQDLQEQTSDFLDNCRQVFQKEMQDFDENWFESDTISELLRLADPRNSRKLDAHKAFPNNRNGWIKQDRYVLLSPSELLRRKESAKPSDERAKRTFSGDQGRKKDTRRPRKPSRHQQRAGIHRAEIECRVVIVEKKGKPRARELEGLGTVAPFKCDDPNVTPEIGSQWIATFNKGNQPPFTLKRLLPDRPDG